VWGALNMETAHFAITGRHHLSSGYELSPSDSGESFARRERMAEGWRRKCVASWSGVPAACRDNRSASSACVHFS